MVINLIIKSKWIFNFFFTPKIEIETIKIEDASKKNPFPCPTTFRTALTYYLDITSLPTTQSLKELAQYASDEEEKKSLQLMGSASEEGKVNNKSPSSFLYSNFIDSNLNAFML